MLYASKQQVLETIHRRTSSQYIKDQQKETKTGDAKPSWEHGSISGPKDKSIDWVDLAVFHYHWWYGLIQFPHSDGIGTKRKVAVQPQAVQKNIKAFRGMYELFLSWLVKADFGRDTLLGIWDLSTKYSIDEVRRCMELVEDKSKRNIHYLDAIIDKEQAILQEELQEARDLNEHSKKTILAIMNLARKSGPVDWEALEKNVKVDKLNQQEFDKVKLS
jgi:hypothetical protein